MYIAYFVFMILDEERDLRLAIELSLKDSLSDPQVESSSQQQQAPPVDKTQENPNPHPTPTAKTQSKSEEKLHYTSRNPDYSSIVNRVPNCSVEDLAQDADTPLEYLGACGGLPSPKQRSPKSTVPPVILGQKTNTFGLIKDISVTNINIPDVDKTKAFEDKVLTGILREANTGPRGNESLYKANIGRHSFSGDPAVVYHENSLEDNSSQPVSVYRPSGEVGMSRPGQSKSPVIMTNQNNLDKGQSSRSSVGGSMAGIEKRETSSAYDAGFYMKKVENVDNTRMHGHSMMVSSPAKKSNVDKDITSKKPRKHRGARSSEKQAGFSEQPARLNNNSNVGGKESEQDVGGGGDQKVKDNNPEIDLDPDDLHIDSCMLESMISGVDDFSPSHCTSNTNPSPTETNMDQYLVEEMCNEEAAVSRPLILNSERTLTNENDRVSRQSRVIELSAQARNSPESFGHRSEDPDSFEGNQGSDRDAVFV